MTSYFVSYREQTWDVSSIFFTEPTLGYNDIILANCCCSKECRCDNGYGSYGRAKSSACSDTCTGDDSQECGGAYANSVYRIRGETIFQL